MDPRQRSAVVEFLYEEAALLDEGNFQEWFDLLTEDIQYQIPTRTTQDRDAESAFSDRSFHMNEDYSSLKARIDRIETEYAWSENPAPRTLRLVNNVIVEPHDEGIDTRDNVVVFYGQGDSEPEFLGAHRQSTLQRTGDSFQISARTVFLNHTKLNIDHLPLL